MPSKPGLPGRTRCSLTPSSPSSTPPKAAAGHTIWLRRCTPSPTCSRMTGGGAKPVRPALPLGGRALQSRPHQGLRDGGRRAGRAASGVYELPFGRLDVTFDQNSLIWGDLRLTEFAPAAGSARSRSAQPLPATGLGAPLAAAASPLKPIEGLQVAASQRAPVTAVLRIEDARRALAEGQLHGILELYTPSDPEEITIAGRAVPLEVEPTASLAAGLEGAPIWKTELSGLLGDLPADAHATRRSAAAPSRPLPRRAGARDGIERRTLGGVGQRPFGRPADPRPLRVLVLLLRDRQPDPLFRAAAAAPGCRRWHRSILQARIWRCATWC